MTQPLDGATVSGTVTVTADASDNLGVAGVQFKLDGANLGTESTAAPHSLSWSTGTAANGAHALSAVARDAAGNSTTSSLVTVTVANAFDTSNALQTIAVGQGYVDSTQRQIVRTSADVVYIFACDDKVAPGVARAWKGNQPGIPTAFAEQDGAHRPTAGGGSELEHSRHDLDRDGSDPSGDCFRRRRQPSRGLAERRQRSPSAPCASRTRTPSGWVADNPPTDVYTHPPTLYARGDDVYVFLGHDASLHYAYLYHLNGQPWSSTIQLSPRDSTDGSASVRWDPQRETNAAVIDTLFYDEDVYDDKTFVPTIFCMAVLPGGAPSSPDTTPPTVSISAPPAGATVSGTAVTVSAAAADNVGVAGVRFKLDGADLGTEQTTAPYSVTWDTTTATDGSHTLAAVACAAGNQTMSSSVGVTVDNAVPPPPSPSGLVAAYSFNEGAGTGVTDSSGHGNNGTVSNTSWSTAGKFGGALSFNGTSSWVTVPDSSSLDLTGAMTLEAWVKPTALGTAWRCVLFMEQPADMVYSLHANESSGHPVAQVFLGGEKNATGSTALPLNAWSFLAATFDGSTLRLFVNGTQAGSIAVTGSMLALAGALHIGGDAVWGEWFAGLIDNIRVYNRTLSAIEIQADMNAAF